jgi:hypothetical protein
VYSKEKEWLETMRYQLKNVVKINYRYVLEMKMLIE